MKKAFVSTVTLLLTSTVLSTPLMVVKADIADYTTHTTHGQVGFVPGNEITPPVNPGPSHPGNPVFPVWPGGDNPAPGTGGALSIDYASSFDFGINNISNQDRTYFAKAQTYRHSKLKTPNYIQVTDSRGTAEGWILKVVEVSQFRHEGRKGSHPVLKGAMISLKNPRAVSQNTDSAPQVQEVLNLTPGTEAVVAKAEPHAGIGTWTIRWGDRLTEADALEKSGHIKKERFNTDIQLFVPGETVKDAASYTTQLKWILSELPQNN